jgi:formylglycine-generating enzyme required for sulfatase activity
MDPKLEGHVQELSGYVWDWTRSRFEPYPYKPDDGRENCATADDSSFTVRGGSFNDDRHMVRASSRLRCRSYVAGGNLGLRVVISRTP